MTLSPTLKRQSMAWLSAPAVRSMNLQRMLAAVVNRLTSTMWSSHSLPYLDRLADFYSAVFGATSTMLDDGAPFRHALIWVGGNAALHAFEIDGSPHGAGLPEMFTRGHLDHVGFTAPDRPAFEEIRRRLVERGACDGTITDFGPVLSVWFQDPDGMGSEVVWVRDPDLAVLHGPQPYPEPPG